MKTKRWVEDERIWYHDLSLFRERFRELIERGGLTYGRLSERTGISRAALESYGHGNRLPCADKVAIFSEYFSVSSDYLLGISLEGETQVGLYESILRSLFPDLNEDQISTLGSSIRRYKLENRRL